MGLPYKQLREFPPLVAAGLPWESQLSTPEPMAKGKGENALVIFYFSNRGNLAQSPDSQGSLRNLGPGPADDLYIHNSPAGEGQE
ncbi:hypothetical protein [Leptolyngbya sp. PCC 6406]|uniref:hypothetical protein n=1 Tax=Leptolyngbya sp. PCC 6406 TaxID=1173264 RepID=UPI0003184021|nr:hypothetical protein [Leptolyngbya sp. PCC 6406]